MNFTFACLLLCAQMCAACFSDFDGRDCAQARLQQRKESYEVGLNILSSVRRSFWWRSARDVWRDVYDDKPYSFVTLCDDLMLMMYDGYRVGIDFREELVIYRGYKNPSRDNSFGQSENFMIKILRSCSQISLNELIFRMYDQGLQRYSPEEIKQKDLFLISKGCHPGIDFEKDDVLFPKNEREQRVKDSFCSRRVNEFVFVAIVGLNGCNQYKPVRACDIWLSCGFGEEKDYNFSGFCRILEEVLTFLTKGYMICADLQNEAFIYQGRVSMSCPASKDVVAPLCQILQMCPKVDSRVLTYLLCEKYNIFCSLEHVRLKEEALFCYGLAEADAYQDLLGCAPEYMRALPRWCGEGVLHEALVLRSKAVLVSLQTQGLIKAFAPIRDLQPLVLPEVKRPPVVGADAFPWGVALRESVLEVVDYMNKPNVTPVDAEWRILLFDALLSPMFPADVVLDVYRKTSLRSTSKDVEFDISVAQTLLQQVKSGYTHVPPNRRPNKVNMIVSLYVNGTLCVDDGYLFGYGVRMKSQMHSAIEMQNLGECVAFDVRRNAWVWQKSKDADLRAELCKMQTDTCTWSTVCTIFDSFLRRNEIVPSQALLCRRVGQQKNISESKARCAVQALAALGLLPGVKSETINSAREHFKNNLKLGVEAHDSEDLYDNHPLHKVCREVFLMQKAGALEKLLHDRKRFVELEGMAELVR